MNTHISNATPPDEPWAKPSPEEYLESVGHYSVCGETSQSLLHADLMNNAFHAAVSKWALLNCAKCRSAYFGPRPTQAGIHWTYANYYTHQRTFRKVDYRPLSPLRELCRRLVNGCNNWRCGRQVVPVSLSGILTAYAIPSVKKVLNHQFHNRQSLRLALTRVGFPASQNRERPRACVDMYRASYAMQHGHSPYDGMETPTALNLQATLAAFAKVVFPSHHEFLTVVARRVES